MARGFAPPKTFRGDGNLRVVLERNWRYLVTFINGTLLARIDDLEARVEALEGP